MAEKGKGQKQQEECSAQLWEFLKSDLFSQTFRPSIPTDAVFIYRPGTADKVIHQVESEVRVNTEFQSMEMNTLNNCIT